MTSQYGRIARDSLTPQILRLWAQGISRRKIAMRLGCSETNVYQAINREKRRVAGCEPANIRRPWSGYVAPLDIQQALWIEDEALKTGVTPDVLARALLIDAINDAQDAKTTDAPTS